VLDGSGRATLWSVGDARARCSLGADATAVAQIALSPDGRSLATVTSKEAAVRLFATRDCAAARTLVDGDAPASALQFMADGRLAVTYEDGSARVWDADAAKALATLRSRATRTTRVAVSRDDARLATAGSAGAAFEADLWDARSAAHIATLSGHAERITSLVFSPDGSTLATGATDQTLRRWDARTGAARGSVKLLGYPTLVRFSPDGAFAVAGGTNMPSPVVIAVSTWAVVGELLGHRESITALEFSADGRLILTASDDLSVGVWDAASRTLVKTLTGPRLLVASPTEPLIAALPNDRAPFLCRYEARANVTRRELAELVDCRIPSRFQGGNLVPSSGCSER
jgi:WD40 repeat protein